MVPFAYPLIRAGIIPPPWQHLEKKSKKIRKTFLQTKIPFPIINPRYAGVAESADALASGASGGNPVKVQILSPAPFTIFGRFSAAVFVFLGPFSFPSHLPDLPQTTLFHLFESFL